LKKIDKPLPQSTRRTPRFIAGKHIFLIFYFAVRFFDYASAVSALSAVEQILPHPFHPVGVKIKLVLAKFILGLASWV
ncbi:MAG: hypothetical protein MUP16_04290, partial [Sedimentisphaerales bacterium]|nr:hypothetical protein [Sedimentisphaerales bacterium]